MVVYDLLFPTMSNVLEYKGSTYQKVMFCVFKDHVNGLVLEDDLFESHNIFMVDLLVQLFPSSTSSVHQHIFCTYRNLSDRALTDAGVGYHVALLVRFKFLDRVYLLVFFQTLGFIHASICSRRYEPQNGVFRRNSTVASVPPSAIIVHGVTLENIVHAIGWHHRGLIRGPLAHGGGR